MTTTTKASWPISTADVEQQQRERGSRLRQAERGEPAREAEAVQKPERECPPPRGGG